MLKSKSKVWSLILISILVPIFLPNISVFCASVEYKDPTPSQNEKIYNNWFIVNMTSNNNLSKSILSIKTNNSIKNISMDNISKRTWYKRVNDLKTGNYTYYIWAKYLNDSWSKSDNRDLKIVELIETKVVLNNPKKISSEKIRELKLNGRLLFKNGSGIKGQKINLYIRKRLISSKKTNDRGKFVFEPDLTGYEKGIYQLKFVFEGNRSKNLERSENNSSLEICGSGRFNAINPKTSACKTFNNSCKIPDEWIKVNKCPECPEKEPVMAKYPVKGKCKEFENICEVPAGWKVVESCECIKRKISGVNPERTRCKTFNRTCDMPSNWTEVNSCKVWRKKHEAKESLNRLRIATANRSGNIKAKKLLDKAEIAYQKGNYKQANSLAKEGYSEIQKGGFSLLNHLIWIIPTAIVFGVLFFIMYAMRKIKKEEKEERKNELLSKMKELTEKLNNTFDHLRYNNMFDSEYMEKSEILFQKIDEIDKLLQSKKYAKAEKELKGLEKRVKNLRDRVRKETF